MEEEQSISRKDVTTYCFSWDNSEMMRIEFWWNRWIATGDMMAMITRGLKGMVTTGDPQLEETPIYTYNVVTRIYSQVGLQACKLGFRAISSIL